MLRSCCDTSRQPRLPRLTRFAPRLDTCWKAGEKGHQQHLDLWAKGIWVALKNGLHCRLARGLALTIIAAVSAVAVVAVAPTGKTFAVQLQAAAVLAVAVLVLFGGGRSCHCCSCGGAMSCAALPPASKKAILSSLALCTEQPISSLS